MGLEFVRGNNGRCPPFLVGGLMVMCLFLVCSWWSLSSQNFELLRQIDNLAEQLKVNGEELNKCADQKLALEERIKDFQSRYNQERVKLDQVKEEVQENNQKWQKQEEELKSEINSKKAEFDRCHTEMESLKSLGESKDKTLETLRTDLEQKKAQIKELEESIIKLNKNIQEKSKSNIVQILHKKLKSKDDNNNNPNDKIQENADPGPVDGGNHELAASQDETNAQESKNDAELNIEVPLDPNGEKVDQRESESLRKGT